MKSDAAIGSKSDASLQVMPCGTPRWGRPLGTGPRTDTPCFEKSKIQLAAIMPTTATRPPGICLIQRPKTMRIASTVMDTSVVDQEASAMCHSVSPNLRTPPLNAPTETFGGGIPSIPPTCPIAT